MAGLYYNNLKNDPSYRAFQDWQDLHQQERQLNLNANYRPALDKAPLLSAGIQPSFYGPLRGVNVTRDSFLQGRGQTLSKCPDCGVRWLPETLFPQKKKSTSAPCYRTDLQPLYTRVPKSCASLSETDISSYFFLPGAWQKGYTGYASIPGTNLQGRDPASLPQLPAECRAKCSSNYGSYGSGYDFSAYT